jgi:hypothetical protein
VNKVLETKPAEISRLLESIMSDKNKNLSSKMMTENKNNEWVENEKNSYKIGTMTANNPKKAK